MSECLAEVGAAVLGGDRRQVMVAEALANRVAWIRTFGLSGVSASSRICPVDSPDEAINGVRVVVLPISGVSKAGIVRSDVSGLTIKIDQDFFKKLDPGCLIVTGSFPPDLKEEAINSGLKVLEYAEVDEIAVPNAIPTAEGAIQLAMENTPFTIDGSSCLVLGYGRVAKALAPRLLSLGADTFVAARNPLQLQEAEDAGYQPLPLHLVAKKIMDFDIIFNSIPALVLTAEIINRADPGLLIIDLASAPGGTDFTAAEKRGIKAILALGLPGKVAPLTAGGILAFNLPGLIEDAFSRELQYR